MSSPGNPLSSSAEDARITSSDSGSLARIETVPADGGAVTDAEAVRGSCIELSRAGLRLFRQTWIAWMVVATSLPYFWNFFARPQGSRYAWILPPFRDDSYGYMAWSQQAAHGALLFKLKFTALPHSPFLFQPFFLLCGWAIRLTGAEPGVVHFVAKEIGVVLFFLVFYRYTDYLRLTAFQSLLASVLVGISSGVGGPIVILFGRHEPPNISVDLWMPEVSTYWSLLWNPLFPWSLALMLLTIYLLDRGTREERPRDLWLAGLAAGALVLIHPYSQPLLLALALLLIAVRRRTRGLGYLVRYLLPLAPFAGYIAALTIWQPLVAKHSASGTMDSPAFWLYLTGFGLPLLIWLAGAAVDRGRWMKQYWQLAAWFGLSLALAYAPLWFQRKLIFGAPIPLCILTALSFDRLLGKCGSLRMARFALATATVVLVPLLALTPIYLIVVLNREVKANAFGVYYISRDMDAGLNYLKQHSKPNDVVMASLGTSLMIPGYAGNTVVWGHWAMAVDSEQRKAWSRELFSPPQNWYDETRAKKFWGSGIDYIFADGVIKKGMEKTEFYKWQIILDDAHEVFRNNDVVIYRRP